MSGQGQAQEKTPVPDKPEYKPLKEAYVKTRLVQDILDNADEVLYLGEYKKLSYYLVKGVDPATFGKIAWIVRVAKNGYVKSATSIPVAMWKILAQLLSQ